MKYFFIIVFSYLCFFVKGQETSTYEELKQKTFGQLDKKKIYNGILINSSLVPVDLESYKGDENQTEANYDTWIKIYNKIYFAHLERPKVPTAKEIFTNAENYFNYEGIVPLGISHFKYSSIRIDAFEKGLLYLDENEVLWEKASNESPYEIKECIAFTPLTWRSSETGEVTFLLSSDFIFDNTDTKITAISVDFSDGYGFREIYINEIVSIVYKSSGLKTIKINIQKGKKVYFLKSNIQIGEDENLRSGGNDLGDEEFPDKTEDIQVTIGKTVKGKWGVYYGCGEHIIDKPVIVIEGFDPLNNKTFNPNNKKKNLYAINDTEQHILKKLREVGYDIIILDFNDNPIDLSLNGRLVAELIKTINNQKVGNNELIVMGRSGGGILARYALAYLENIGINHQTRLLLTIDSPHQGANIPLGFQHFLNFATNDLVVNAILGTIALLFDTYLLQSSINSIYSKQILYYHHSASSNNAYPSLKNDFFSNLNNLNGGYPKKLMKVAISSGSKNGTNQGFGFNKNLLQFDQYNDLPNCAINKISISAKSLPDKNISGSIMSASIGTRFPLIPCILHTNWITNSKSITVNNALPYDNSPGGSAGWHNFNLGEIIPDIIGLFSGFTNEANVEDNNSCFVPVISAIDLNSNILPSTSGGLFYNVNSNLSNNSNIKKVNNLYYNLSPPSVSPFDIIYVAPSNQEHGKSNSEWQELFNNVIMPSNLYLQNQNIVNNRTYHSRNQITVGNNVTSSLPQGDFVVKTGTNVKMTAGSSVILKPGFKTEPGATYHATIHSETNCTISKSTDIEKEFFQDYDIIAKTELFSENENSIFDMIISTEKTVTIYPNPANSHIIVSFNKYLETDIIIEILDTMGKILSIRKDASRINEFDISNYPAGIYFVKILANEKFYTEKFVKQ